MAKVITAKREGFRRCGVAHSKAPVKHADDAFSEAQWAELDADPSITVQDLGIPIADPKTSTKKIPKKPAKKSANKSDGTEAK